MPRITVDTESRSLQNHFALVHTRRKSRKRFPDGCVSPMGSAEEALAAADSNNNLYPAVVYGPSKSSEGVHIYYLVRWLTST